jgi:uncharacterized protein
MAGETDLALLLRSMQPVLRQHDYVFCRAALDMNNPLSLNPVGLFYEDEGLTLILRREDADRVALSYSTTFRMITLSVHSSLEAVGFLATITSKLAQHGISVNPISAYYHDHLFVPASRADDAMQLLRELSG